MELRLLTHFDNSSGGPEVTFMENQDQEKRVRVKLGFLDFDYFPYLY